ncbi:unnamed protein product [Bursaphelenchus xylophilus]|uniref:(pine wood nematode) hypothetical protein n=1 Tax=Bursaphelenchus xylophilus TaxID=6326 RepID=A0A1I7ST98_BURXY|nr:unnamed protein product [Bursaphelenchus xylophilus]CAG9108625.1 unnamed protein product [Bursaphelenchus xylophilus]
MNHFRPGQPIECLSIEIELEKEKVRAPDGTVVEKVGFKIGGGIDQDPQRSPFKYPDTGIYITWVENGSPAELVGLKQHDKILGVNGYDFTMVTHERAVKCIKRNPKLKMLIARREVAI